MSKYYKRTPCPECGGPKAAVSKQCQKCDRARRHASAVVQMSCTCGRPKAWGADQCMSCFNRRHQSLYCDCAVLIIERISWFDTFQCGKCGRPFKDEARVREIWLASRVS